MGTLQIGRVGIDTTLSDPYQIDQRGAAGGPSLTIRGHIKDTATLEEANHLRTEMLAQIKSDTVSGLVPVISTTDPEIDGFYILTAASVGVSHRMGSLVDKGFIPYTVSLQRVNTNVFSAGLTGGVLPNDHSISSAEPIVAPPQGVTSFTPELTSVLRASAAGGSMRIFRNCDETQTPFFSLVPADYYGGAAKLSTGSPLRLRSGTVIPNDPADWRLDNDLARITSASVGRFTTEMHGGSTWESSKEWRIDDNGSAIFVWGEIICLRNDPEEVSIRLIQNRSTQPVGRRTLDISLRRGSRHASFLFTVSASVTIKIVRQTSDSGTNISTWGVRDSTNDGDGNRWIVGSIHTVTQDTSNGGIQRASSTSMDFFVGYEEDGSSALAGNVNTDIGDNYFHHIAERVSPVVAAGVIS